MVDIGFNYRMTDIQCALGISQLKKLPEFLMRRREIAARYDDAFKDWTDIVPLACRDDVSHAYHLYVVLVKSDRDGVFKRLREKGVGVNVHYIPVHLHPFYQEKFATETGALVGAEGQ